jgi:zinc D-Ala-D-Ala carboxypeptidase
MQLSKNFNLVELTKSQTAERKGIPNDPSPDHQENLRLLCERVLQPVRDHFNHVVSISSGYRSPQLCQAIGSSHRFAACKRDGGGLRNLWHT